MKDGNQEAALWLTLVDFLIQILVFGLFCVLLFSAADFEATAIKATPSAPSTDSPLPPYAAAAGYPSVSALTDELTRLVPADRFRDLLDGIKRAGGVQPLLTRALGFPPCKVGPEGTGFSATATVRVTDDFIEFERETAALNELLGKLGLTFEDVQQLSIDQFRRSFSSLQTKEPNCRHYLDVIDQYTTRSPREALESAFYLGRRIRQ